MFMECPAGCSWNGWPDDVECARKIKKRVIDDLFATYATGRISGAGLRDRWEMVEDRWGVHVPTLLAAIRDFPDYRPADPGEEEFNLS